MPIRDATPTDVPALLEVMFADPPIEAVRMARGADRARRFQAELFRHAFDDGSIVLTAVEHDAPVGFAWLMSSDHSEVPSLGRLTALAVHSWMRWSERLGGRALRTCR